MPRLKLALVFHCNIISLTVLFFTFTEVMLVQPAKVADQPLV